MNRKWIVLILILATWISVQARDSSGGFTIVREIPHLPVIDQGSTGTCWSFATTSFLEAEIIRKGLPETDLSEMYFVNYAYKNKALKAVSSGSTRIGEGGLSHDVMDVVREKGVVIAESFPGIMINGRFRHRSLVSEMRQELREFKESSGKAEVSLDDTLDALLTEHLGQVPPKTKWKNRKMKPLKLKEELKIDVEDYVELSSYNHHPFYEQFILDVRDNWSGALYYNLPIDELLEVLNYSLENGYTICWDGDDSEETFEYNNGIAYLPENLRGKVDQELRQKTFDDGSTSDDHLMHIVGRSKDSKGRNCYYTKNSWGSDSNDYGGYLHLTEDYVRLKTISVMVHIDGIPLAIRKKLNL